jgi:hypothetical protein
MSSRNPNATNTDIRLMMPSHCTPDKSLAVITPTIMVATIAPKSIMPS